ncbi:hypothetical protein [Thermovirga lienii]|uniref:hypothetical protein n=1 Tax=Thermovirga lienii TaxID=336261 RepID=UPI002FE315E5
MLRYRPHVGEDDKALIKLAYEMLPVPEEGQVVDCLNRFGEAVAKGKVVKVTEPMKDKTLVVHVEIPKDLVMDIRAIKVV